MAFTTTNEPSKAAWTFPAWLTEQAGQEPGALVVRGDATGLGWEKGSDETNVLASLYVFADHTAVRAFLLYDPVIRALLFDAFPRITLVFGAAAQVTLDVLHDPEGGSDPPFLTALITTELDPEQALAHLEEFDESWWREVGRRHGQLVIDVD